MNSELETWIVLKFIPPRPTEEYVLTIPTPILEFFTNNSKEPIRTMIRIIQDFPNPKSNIWNIYLRELIAYYKNEQRP